MEMISMLLFQQITETSIEQLVNQIKQLDKAQHGHKFLGTAMVYQELLIQTIKDTHLSLLSG